MLQDLINLKMNEKELRQVNPIVLAFVGDAIYEVIIRTYLVSRNENMLVNKLHKKTIEFVKAESQSKFSRGIIELLNEQEMSIFKRGRNTKSHVPKNASVSDYRAATGFEAVLGYLYLNNQKDRLNFIISKVIDLYEEDKNVTKS